MSGKVHFYNLDILRFVCAFAVAFGHAFEAFIGWFDVPVYFKTNPYLFKVVRTFVGNLSLGVGTFFVISGFLITYLMLLEKESHGNLHVGKYMIRRALRIWPLYYISILFGYLLVEYLQIQDKPDYWMNILFLNNFHLIKTQIWQFPFAHFWSISVEEHFYLVWPIVIYLTPVKRLPVVSIIGILISVFSRYYVRATTDNDAVLQIFCFVHSIARMDELLIGSLLAYLYFKKPFTFSFENKFRYPIYISILIVLCIWPYFFYYESWFDTLFKKYIYISFILFWVINYMFNSKALFNFKSKNFIHYLGRISFGIYIYHNMILTPYITKIVYTFNIQNMVLFIALYFVILIFISIISYECIEKHFLKFKERFSIVKTEH